MTREHVFAHWLVRKVHGARLLASNTSPASLSSSTAPIQIARVVADVCAECNAGWMSTLEVGFRRLVFARPRVGTVPAPDRITLSRWFTKTAVLLAHACGDELLDASERQRLIVEMPNDVEVFLARRRRPPQKIDFRLDVLTDDDADNVRARSVAIQIDDIVGHVAKRGTLASRPGTRVWPLRSHTLRWETLPVISAARRGR